MEKTTRSFTVGDDFRHRYPGAFSASDIYALIRLPGGTVRGIGNLAALSISTHRDSFPVTALSHVNPKGFVQGHRIIAGTMIFHTLDRGAFQYGMDDPQYNPQQKSRGSYFPQPDSLPLFDLSISYMNDNGMFSTEGLLGIRILDFGKSVSLENLHPMESYSYMALSYEPMRPLITGDEITSQVFTLRRDPRAKSGVKVHGGSEPTSRAVAPVDPFQVGPGLLVNETLGSEGRRLIAPRISSSPAPEDDIG